MPPQVLFPQFVLLVEEYVDSKVLPLKPADKKDAFLSPYYGWLVERLTSALVPLGSDEADVELPRFETHRGVGSTEDVDYWTTKDVREVTKSHINYVVADTRQWEQQAAYIIDRHQAVHSFVKNAGLGFFIPYTHNGQRHDYLPDFIIRLNTDEQRYLILETKGWDPLEEVKVGAARRWTAAVNAAGGHGEWRYNVVKRIENIAEVLDLVASTLLS